MDTMPMRWAEKQDYTGSLDHCACCGRKLKGARLWVEVIDGGATVVAPGMSPDSGDGGYMGFFPVGTTCAKKHFSGFARPFTNTIHQHHSEGTSMNEMIKGGWVIENPEGGGEGWEVADCYGIAATVHGEPEDLEHRQNAAAVESVPVMLDLLQRLALAEPGEMANLVGEAEALLARIDRGEFLPEGSE